MISICWVSRNDDHGGRLIERIQAALDALDYYIHSTGTDVELLFVEWNPVSSAPLLRHVVDTLSIPTRWYIVPHSLHTKLENSSIMPIFQHIGCNVGLRRARGDWFLTTTHDCIWTRELADSLADDFLLDKNHFYRARRCDCEAGLATAMSVTARMEYMSYHVIRMKDWKEGLFTGACGDFILAPRSHWNNIRGYPEWTMSGQYLDGLVLYRLIASGLSQHVLKGLNFHMEHGERATEALHLPHLPASMYKRLGERMVASPDMIHINGDQWGLLVDTEKQVEYNVWELNAESEYQLEYCEWRKLDGILS